MIRDYTAPSPGLPAPAPPSAGRLGVPRILRVWLGAACAALLLLAGSHAAAAPPQPSPAPPTVHFPVSAPPQVQAVFERGLEWLHSFEYERALESFQAAQRAAPGFALAYWGEALCYHQSLWLNEDVNQARAILARLGTTPEARARMAGTPRERAYLATAEVLFGPGDATTRRAAYADAMRRLSEQYPDDDDALALYGLALLGTVSRGQQVSAAGDVEQPLLAGSDVQLRAAEIFERVLARNPRHPGALHYLIHTYDDPVHAHLALEAARAYPAVAPESSHARHMPAHVFVQLGLWKEASTSDESAFAASEKWVAERGLPDSMKDYHALSWLSYEYLQQGRFRQSRAAVDLAGQAANAASSPRLQSTHATMLARYVLESGDWLALRTNVSRNDWELFAIGFSAVQRGELPVAATVRKFLDEMAADPKYEDRRAMLEIMRRELAGAAMCASGQRDEGLALLREAAEREHALPPPLGPIVPVKPASELLGEVLLDVRRPGEADQAFAAALERGPGRSRAILGRARAAAMRGDYPAALGYYRTFAEHWREADAGLPEIAEAQQAIENGGRVAGAGIGAGSNLVVAAAVAALALVIGSGYWWVRRTRRAARRQPAPTPSRPGGTPPRQPAPKSARKS